MKRRQAEKAAADDGSTDNSAPPAKRGNPIQARIVSSTQNGRKLTLRLKLDSCRQKAVVSRPPTVSSGDTSRSTTLRNENGNGAGPSTAPLVNLPTDDLNHHNTAAACPYYGWYRLKDAFLTENQAQRAHYLNENSKDGQCEATNQRMLQAGNGTDNELSDDGPQPSYLLPNSTMDPDTTGTILTEESDESLQ